ncbi:YhgE/Pip family protein [Conyzicola sp.]|uniref:YhgE/Pip family protein n=1 Tax=Conyzicola sp. TaxID=1969404 RepID=UPI0039894719
MIITLVRTELARLTSSKMGILSLVALMTVPLVYGGLYLWGNQDPYSRLDQIPAALVVDDTGATNDDGVAVNYGQDAADELLDGMDFGWVEVSAAQAKAGIVSGEYDFGLTFPADFSTDLVSAGGDDPTAAQLALTTSDTNSYLSSTLAERAAEAVRVTVAEQLGEEAAGTLLDSLEQVREGLIDAADGATQLSDGAATAATGAHTLADGAASAASGAASLSTGNASLSTGATKLSTGLSQLDTQAGALPGSTAALATGAASVASGASTAATGEAALVTPAAQASQLSAAVQTESAAAFADGIVTPDESTSIQKKLAQLAALTTGVSDGTAKIAPGLSTLSSGAAQVSAGTNTLNAQAPVLANAVHTAATGAATLASGAKSAASGASGLATGTAQLSTGATDLSTGIDSLASGSSELSTSLGDAVVKIPGSTDAERSKAAAAIADPVLVKRTSLTEAENYGAGLAPFFITLAAWIGMYALFLLVRPLSRRALTAVRRPVRTALAGWLTPALLGVLQVAGLFAIVTFGLGMHSANPLGLLGFLAFISITFASIILALNVWLGSVGQFIGLILMVVQLVTAGGTFPWQTLPAPLAFIHQGLPMSHAVDGVRQLMYGGSPAAFWASVLPLAAWLLISLAASALGALKQGRFRTLRELRPSPIGA